MACMRSMVSNSDMPGGRLKVVARSAAGIGAKSSSTLATPIAESISAISSGVWGKRASRL